MSDSESDDDESHSSSSSSFSLSESSASSSASSKESQPSQPGPQRARADKGRSGASASSNLTSSQRIYSRFLRKPSTESNASLGRKRQERSYSDSENSYENDIPGRGNREGRGFYQVNGQEDFHWGRQPLWQGLPIEQVENLVAWAHHGVEPKKNPLEVTMPPDMALLHQEWVDHNNNQNDDPGTRNPLLNYVNTPLPLSFLNYFMLRSIHVKEFSDGLWESFDTSALVAIGMIVEEIITASLLPFAGLHALRCKQLEARPTKDEALLARVTQVSLTHPIIPNYSFQFDRRHLPDDETAFTAWTLPPEEAIWKLAAQGMIPDTGTPLVRDPIRSCQPASNSDQVFHLSTNKEVVGNIFQELGIDPKKNQEYLNLFLSRDQRKKQQDPVENNDNTINQKANVDDNDNSNFGDSEPPEKRIRMTEV